MYIFVDLDGTLFDTPRLGLDTALFLKEEFGISPDDYEAARRVMFAMNNKIYSAELHARRLAKITKIDESLLVKKFIDLFNNEDSMNYVYPDSVDFLKSCSKLGQVVILTFGEAFVQSPRATKSGLRSLVHDVIVTQYDKAATIRDYFSSDNMGNKLIGMVDDSLEHLNNIKERFINSITIHLDRNSIGGTSSEHHRAVSLQDAFKILESAQNQRL